ncbi:MAG: ribonuclease [Clostridia bacterium]|nr:ribonuclease [Clostridia bacterium]
MKAMKRLLRAAPLLLLAVLLLLTLTACGRRKAEEPQLQDLPLITDDGQTLPETPDAPAPEQTAAPDKEGYYYDVESVVLYLHAYGTLPGNYITKSEARELGWSGGSPEKYREGAAIGGDSFGNRENQLPKASGRKYTECDIDTLGADGRGAKRLVFSNDGLYFYTDDHYNTFREIYVTEEGTTAWR